MNTRKLGLRLCLSGVFGAIAVIGGLALTTISASAKSPSATLDVTTTGGDADGVNKFYFFTGHPGDLLDETIEVCARLTDSSGSWNKFTLTFSKVAGNLPDIATITIDHPSYDFVPGDLGGDCKNTKIEISGTLPDVTTATGFAGNLHIGPVTGQQTDPKNLTVAIGPTQNIHILLQVTPTVESEAPTCYFTDQSGIFLLVSSGVYANQSGETDGKFTYSLYSGGTNAGKIQSTNPTGFYYYFAWHNTTGSTQNVTFAKTLTDVVETSGQPLKYLVTTTSPTVTGTGFTVPAPGTGANIPSPIVVPSNSWLIFSDSLDYAKKGQVPTDPLNTVISETMSITNDGSPSTTTWGPCTAGATDATSPPS